MERLPQSAESTNEPLSVPDRLATESGFKQLREKVARITDFAAAHETQREVIDELRREASTVAEYLFNARKSVPHSSPERPLLDRLVGLVSNMSEELGSFVFFKELQRDKPDAPNAGVVGVAISDLGIKLAKLRTEFAEVPIESSFNRWRLLRVLRKAGMATGLLVAGVGMGDSQRRPEKGESVREPVPQAVVQEKAPEKTETKKTDPEGAVGGRSSLAKREATEPDMRQNNAEAGRFSEEVVSLGSIDYEYSAHPTDSLWITGYQLMTHDRGGWGSATGPVSKAESIENGSAFATVKLDLARAAAGNTKIVLPVPVGKEILSTSISGAEGSYDATTHTFTFDKIPTNGTLTYQVVTPEFQPSFNFRFTGLALRRPDNRTPGELEVLKNASGSGLSYERLLGVYLEKFNSVVSSDLQASILDKLPGHAEEKAAQLLIGDCDMLAAAGVRFLAGDSQFEAAIAVGFVEKDMKIDGNSPHAKIYYEGELIEATAYAKQAFINLTLRDHDRAQLSGLADAVAAAGEGALRDAAYAALRDRLHEVLSDPYYKKFEAKGMSFEAPRFSDMQQLWRQIRSDFSGTEKDGEGRTLEQMIVGLSAALIIASMSIAGFKGAQYGNRKASLLMLRLIRDGMRKDVAEFIADSHALNEKHGRSGSPEHVAYYNQILADVYTTFPFLGKSLSLDKALTMSLESKREYVRLLRTVSGMIDAVKHDPSVSSDKEAAFKRNTLSIVFNSVIMRHRFALEFSKVAREGVPVGSMTEDLLAIVRNPQHVEEWRKGIAADVQDIVRDAVKNLKPLSPASAVKFPVEYRKRVLDSAGFDTGRASETAYKSRPGVMQNEEVFDTRDFVQGDDMRNVDWLRSARSEKLQIKQSPEAKREAPKGKPMEIVLDGLLSTGYIPKLAEILVAAEQAPSALNVAGVTIVAYGEVVERINGKDLRRLASEGGQLAPAQFVLTRLYEAFFSKVIRNPETLASGRVLSKEVLLSLPFDVQKPGEVLVFGNVPMKLAGKTRATFATMKSSLN